MWISCSGFVMGCRFVDKLFWVCGGLPIWVLGGDGGVLWMSYSRFVDGFVLRVCGFGDGDGGRGSFRFGFRLWGWKNGFGVGSLWCFGGGSG